MKNTLAWLFILSIVGVNIGAAVYVLRQPDPAKPSKLHRFESDINDDHEVDSAADKYGFD